MDHHNKGSGARTQAYTISLSVSQNLLELIAHGYFKLNFIDYFAD